MVFTTIYPTVQTSVRDSDVPSYLIIQQFTILCNSSRFSLRFIVAAPLFISWSTIQSTILDRRFSLRFTMQSMIRMRFVPNPLHGQLFESTVKIFPVPYSLNGPILNQRFSSRTTMPYLWRWRMSGGPGRARGLSRIFAISIGELRSWLRGYAGSPGPLLWRWRMSWRAARGRLAWSRWRGSRRGSRSRGVRGLARIFA